MSEQEVLIDSSDDSLSSSSSLEKKRLKKSAEKSKIKTKQKSRQKRIKSMKNKTETSKLRADEFKDDGLYSKDGKLRCKICGDKELDLKLWNIKMHIRSNKHKENAIKPQSSSKQPTIDGLQQQNSTRQLRVQELNKAAVKAFAEANIPLTKFDHLSIRSLFATHVINGESLYTAMGNIGYCFEFFIIFLKS
jgi:hypothetical protein